MDDFIYRKFFGPIRLGNMRHHLLPCHNLVDMEAIHETRLNELDNDIDDPYCGAKDRKSFLDSFPCYKKFDYEAGLASVLYCGSGTCDEAEDFLKKKLAWAKNLHYVTPKNPVQIFKNITAYKMRKAKALSKSSKKFLIQFFKDPEPNFKGGYNWLYTGGSMSHVNYDGSTLLCCGDVINDTHVLKLLELSEDLTEVIDFERFDLKTNEPVLQTCCRKKDQNIVLSVRQKNRLTLLTTNGKWDMNLKWKKKIKKKKLITCIDINSHCEDIVVTDICDDLQNINIYSIDTGRKKFGLCRRCKGLDNNWNQVSFSDQNIFFMDRKNIRLIDTRTKDYAWKFSPKLVMEECDNICNFMESELNPNYVYLTMTHNLTQLDTRVIKPVQKWTHMMHDVPQHGSIIADGDKELIILQSKQPDSCVGITNEYMFRNNEYMYLSKSLPCLLKGVKESVKLAHYNELCLNPLLSSRFNSSVVGCDLIKDKKGNINYLVNNGLGDIFRYKIKDTQDAETDDEDKILDSLRKYEEHFENLNVAKNFVPSKTVNMSQCIENKIQKINQKKQAEKKGKRKKHPKPWKYGEMYTVESLKFYKDFLAEKILRVWGIENVDDDDDDDNFEDQISVSDKVGGWLEHL